MSHDHVRFSIVVPTFQSASFIGAALDSIFSQTEPSYEVIVSDDGSTDGTAGIVHKRLVEHKEINARFITAPHKGPGAARNAGVRAARGEWIAFLDADDKWYPEKLHTVCMQMKKCPAVDLWCHSEILRDGVDVRMLEYHKAFTESQDPFLLLYRSNCLSTSAVTVRKTALEEAGMFDESLPSAQDYDLWLRLSQRARLGFIPTVLGEYKVRPFSISENYEQRLACLLIIGKKYLTAVNERSRMPFIDYLRFRSSAYLAAGLGMISSSKKLAGLWCLMLGSLQWPFQLTVLKYTIRKIRIA